MNKEKQRNKLGKDLAALCLGASRRGLSAELILDSQLGYLHGLMQKLGIKSAVISNHLRRVADDIDPPRQGSVY